MPPKRTPAMRRITRIHLVNSSEDDGRSEAYRAWIVSARRSYRTTKLRKCRIFPVRRRAALPSSFSCSTRACVYPATFLPVALVRHDNLGTPLLELRVERVGFAGSVSYQTARTRQERSRGREFLRQG